MHRNSSVTHLEPSQVLVPRGSGWSKLWMVGLGLGLCGGVGALALGASDAKQLYYSYLTAYLFFLSIALGGLFFVLLQFATKSGWSVAVRRLAESIMVTLPLFVLLFLPVVLGAHDLYHWTHHDAVAEDPVLSGKTPYLNLGFFLARSALYLLVWTGLSLYFYRASVRQDESADHTVTRRLQRAAPPSLVAYGLTLTFAAFDWIMALEPHWFSTIFGVYFFAGSTLSIYATLSVLSVALTRSGLLSFAVTREHFHDLGKMLLAFTAFWAYIAFSQYFLIWYANIPEETFWYLQRWEGSWQWASVALALGHFVLPFFFLLPRAVKRSPRMLVSVALWQLAMHYLDIYWQVMPSLHRQGVQPHLLDLLSLLAVGGVMLAGLGWLLRGRPLVPVGDPRLPESLAFENL